METDGHRHGSMPPGRSPANRERSASPRARHDRYERREPHLGWGYNSMSDCIVHHGVGCKKCTDYVMHLTMGSMEDDPSYIDAVAKRQNMFVPFEQWRSETLKVDDLEVECDKYRDRCRAAEKEASGLRERVHELEEQLAALQGSSFAATASRAISKPLTQRVQGSGGKGTFPPLPKNVVKTTTSVSTTSSSTAPTNKGKGRATGPTGLPTMDYEAEMQFDDEEGDSDWEDPAADAKAVDSHTARQVRAILQGSRQTHHAGGSGSSGGRVPDIHPGTSAEFRYARNALEQAHRDNNANKKVLLACIRKYISSCHAATNKTRVQQSAIQGWRVPDWAEKMRYNPNTGGLESTGHTKAELNADQPRGGELHDGILLQVSNILGLSKDGKPHPCLGNMSSPRHEDHPLVWRYWLKHVATQLPRGLVPGPDGLPYERIVRGFRRIQPFFKERKGLTPGDRTSQRAGQLMLMGLVVKSRRYDELLRAGGLVVHPKPLWDYIVFSTSPSEAECAQHLAARGVTVDEVADAQQYAYCWLQAYQAHLVDTQERISINSLLESIRALQDPGPWPDHLTYYYDQGLARWMPELPPTRTTATVVQFNSSATSGSVGTLPLTGGPSSGPQSNSTPATGVAGSSTGPVIPDENVEMKDGGQ